MVARDPRRVEVVRTGAERLRVLGVGRPLYCREGVRPLKVKNRPTSKNQGLEREPLIPCEKGLPYFKGISVRILPVAVLRMSLFCTSSNRISRKTEQSSVYALVLV